MTLHHARLMHPFYSEDKILMGAAYYAFTIITQLKARQFANTFLHTVDGVLILSEVSLESMFQSVDDVTKCVRIGFVVRA